MRAFIADILISEEGRKKKFAELIQQKQFDEAERVLHRLQRGTYIGDFVYGASDGIVTTFAVVAGAAGASFVPGIVLILGIANLIADGFSMGASNVLSLRSQGEFFKAQRRKEEWEVENFPELEEEEVRVILRRWRLKEEYIEPVASAITENKEQWVDFMMREELDLKNDSNERSFSHGAATFGSFVMAGAVPLIPYLVNGNQESLFLLSGVFAGLAFFGVGAARTFVTGEHPVKGGLEILVIGGMAAAVAFSLGWIIRTLFGITL